jgi:hypothetical protein
MTVNSRRQGSEWKVARKTEVSRDIAANCASHPAAANAFLETLIASTAVT